MNANTLVGKNIAIAGASKGIGRETAKLLNNLGVNLLLGARNVGELKSASWEELSKVTIVELDVKDERSVKRFLFEGEKQLGKIDAIVNCAGYGSFDSALELATEDFDRMVDTNLKGMFLSCKHFGKHMVENEQGRILNIISIAGNTAMPGCVGYSASKFGALGLSKVFQAELREKNVYVTSILPGSVNSEFWDNIDTPLDKNKMIQTDVIAEHILNILCQPNGAVIDEVTIMPPLGIL